MQFVLPHKQGRVNAAEAASLVGDKRVEDSDLVPEVYEGVCIFAWHHRHVF